MSSQRPRVSMLARRTLLLLTLVCFLVPQAAASGSITIADPVGDARPGFQPGLPMTDLLVQTCADPAVDLTRTDVSSDDTTITFRMTFVDLHAPPSCSGVPLPIRDAGYVLEVRRPTSVPSFLVQVVYQGTGWLTCRFVGLADGMHQLDCLPFTLPAGNTLTWTIPAHGSSGSISWDARGLSYDVSGHIGLHAGLPDPTGLLPTPSVQFVDYVEDGHSFSM